MKALDMTPIIKKYPGQFVALTRNRKRVLSAGLDPAKVLKKARKKGVKDPILTRIPSDNRSYLL